MISITKKTPPIWDVIVIGGGPAGMMSALRAKERGLSVLLLEKNKKLGKKLLITGGGRCNITNATYDSRALLVKYKKAQKFLFSPFSQFAVFDTVNFFESRGLALKIENERRMFPVTDSARSVWEVLVNDLQEKNVVVRHSSKVNNIINNMRNNIFEITLQSPQVGKISKKISPEVLYSRACIVASGGTSHPETGSTGDGFKWLNDLDHSIIPNSYSLVPITIAETWIKKVSGLTIPDVKLSLYSDTKKHSIAQGKILFTHTGLSGPTILNMSKTIGDLLSYSAVELHLDLFPHMDHGQLDAYVLSLLTQDSNKMIKNSLHVLIPKALIPIFLSMTNIEGETQNNSLQKDKRKALVTLLKCVTLRVRGLLGSDKAVVSSGGVKLEEIDTRTMQSRIIPELYCVGDVLNIDRPSGGYSLQLCWTTGYVAGDNVLKHYCGTKVSA